MAEILKIFDIILHKLDGNDKIIPKNTKKEVSYLIQEHPDGKFYSHFVKLL